MTENDIFRAAARKKLVIGDGEFNVDYNAVVSPSDEGAYVQVWAWVSNEDAGFNKSAQGVDEKDS